MMMMTMMMTDGQIVVAAYNFIGNPPIFALQQFYQIPHCGDSAVLTLHWTFLDHIQSISILSLFSSIK